MERLAGKREKGTPRIEEEEREGKGRGDLACLKDAGKGESQGGECRGARVEKM